jgi:hypothetical protein
VVLGLLAYPLVVAPLLVEMAGMEAAHHRHGGLPDGADGPLADCRGSRGSLSRCSHQAPILACRSRSFRSDKWGQLLESAPEQFRKKQQPYIAVP